MNTTLAFLKENLPLNYIMDFGDSCTIDGIITVKYKINKIYLRETSIGYKELNEDLIKILKDFLKLENKYKQVFAEDYNFKNKNIYSEEHLYFLVLNNKVKIGKSKNIKNRICQLKTAIAEDFKVYYINNKGIFEKDLHNYFSDYRLNGEWFNYNLRIQRFINNYVKKNHLSSNFLVEERIINDLIFPYGKYKNEYVKEIITKDPIYCRWLITTDIFSSKINKYIESVLVSIN